MSVRGFSVVLESRKQGWYHQASGPLADEEVFLFFCSKIRIYHLRNNNYPNKFSYKRYLQKVYEVTNDE